MGCVFCVHLTRGVSPDAGALVKGPSQGNVQGLERGGDLSVAAPRQHMHQSPKARQASGQGLGNDILGARGRRKAEQASLQVL